MISTYLGMLHQPSVSADRIARQPNWVAPLLVLVMVVVTYTALTSSRRVDEWIQDLRANPEISEAEVERRIQNLERQQQSAARFVGWAAAPVLTAARVALVAGAWWLLALLFFGAAPYRLVLAVYAYSTVIEVLRHIMVFVMEMAADTRIETGLLAFAGDQALPILVARALHSIDIFGVWQFVVCGICFAKIHGRSSNTGLGMAVIAQAVWTIVYALVGSVIRVV